MSIYGSTDIMDFYSTARGAMVAAHLGKDIQALWSNNNQNNTRQSGVTRLAVGVPFALVPADSLPAVLMPDILGGVSWPADGPVRTAVIESSLWPIAAESIDKILMVHALEYVPDPLAFLGEVSRVLTGEGRLILAVAHRRGLWARAEHSPFGHGTPYSRGQLNRLLHAAGLEPIRFKRGLALPPFADKLPTGMARHVTRFGSPVLHLLGGVLLIEAQKRRFAARPSLSTVKRSISISAVPKGLKPAFSEQEK